MEMLSFKDGDKVANKHYHVRMTWGTLGLSLPGYVIEHTDWDRIVTRDVYEVLSYLEEKCMRRRDGKSVRNMSIQMVQNAHK